MTTIAAQLRQHLVISDWLTINGQPVAFPTGDDLEDLTIHHSRTPQRKASAKTKAPGTTPRPSSDPSRHHHGRRSAQRTRT